MIAKLIIFKSPPSIWRRLNQIEIKGVVMMFFKYEVIYVMKVIKRNLKLAIIYMFIALFPNIIKLTMFDKQQSNNTYIAIIFLIIFYFIDIYMSSGILALFWKKIKLNTKKQSNILTSAKKYFIPLVLLYLYNFIIIYFITIIILFFVGINYNEVKELVYFLYSFLLIISISLLYVRDLTGFENIKETYKFIYNRPKASLFFLILASSEKVINEIYFFYENIFILYLFSFITVIVSLLKLLIGFRIISKECK